MAWPGIHRSLPASHAHGLCPLAHADTTIIGLCGVWVPTRDDMRAIVACVDITPARWDHAEPSSLLPTAERWWTWRACMTRLRQGQCCTPRCSVTWMRPCT